MKYRLFLFIALALALGCSRRAFTVVDLPAEARTGQVFYISAEPRSTIYISGSIDGASGYTLSDGEGRAFYAKERDGTLIWHSIPCTRGEWEKWMKRRPAGLKELRAP